MAGSSVIPSYIVPVQLNHAIRAIRAAFCTVAVNSYGQPSLPSITLEPARITCESAEEKETGGLNGSAAASNITSIYLQSSLLTCKLK